MFPAAFLSHATAKLRPADPLPDNLMGQDADDIRLMLTELDYLQKFLSRCGEQIQLHPYLYYHRIVSLEDMINNLEDLAEAQHRPLTRPQTTLPIIFQKTCGMCMSPVHVQVLKATGLVKSIFRDFFGRERSSSSISTELLASGRDTAPDNVKGMNTEKEILLRCLGGYSSGGNPEVITIFGNRGLGKTTLARLVYREKQEERYTFDPQSWVNVSRTSSLRSIAEDILKSWNQQGTCQNTDEEEIMQRVVRNVRGRTWLLALDGVENENEDLVRRLLDELRSASDPDSKFLVITRSSSISESFTTQTTVHLQGLSANDACDLLKATASLSELDLRPQGRESQQMTKLAMEIANDVCKGVPRAIKLVGCFLKSGGHSIEGWKNIKECGLLKPSHIFPADVEIFESLQSKLDLLPSNLQLCFCYCGLFPKGHDIDLATLIALWMAQGFINSEETGDDCFHRLLKLNLFCRDDIQRDELGRERRCRMQDLTHDLALYVSSNRIFLMDPQGEAVQGRVVHHIALDFNLDSSWQIPKSLLNSRGLRTILLSPQSRLPKEVKLSTSTCRAIFSSFKKLRALDLHDLGMETVPDSLGNLKQLRYLDLSNNSFVTLPRCTTSLLYLQTLKLSNCHKLKELPVGFRNLVNLRHLHIDGCFSLTYMPLGLGSLTPLQTLSIFVASEIRNSADLEQLKSLNNLRGNLEILHLERAKCDPSKADDLLLSEKKELQCLTLRWNRDFDDEDVEEKEDNPDEGQDERLLEILKPHPDLKTLCIMGFKGNFPFEYFTVPINLVKISLYHCPVIQFLPHLHQLSSLKILELQRLEAMEFVADSLASAPTGTFFPSLKEVTIWDCPRLTSWWKSGAASSPRGIEKLEIRYCPKLTTIPFHPEKLILACYNKDQLEEIMKTMAERPYLWYSSPVHNELKSLTIGRTEDLISLPEKGLESFTSLQSLHIQNCHKLTSISQGIKHLSSLESLNIENCMELNLGKDDGSQWKSLIKLRTLIISAIPKLEALPQGLQHAKSLQDLQLYSCPGLMSLPKWIGELTSLETIKIEDCPKLRPRIQQGTGEDWLLIANKLK